MGCHTSRFKTKKLLLPSSDLECAQLSGGLHTSRHSSLLSVLCELCLPSFGAFSCLVLPHSVQHPQVDDDGSPWLYVLDHGQSRTATRPGYSYATLRPYRVGPQRHVPAHIPKPDYALNGGDPLKERTSEARSTPPVLTAAQIKVPRRRIYQEEESLASSLTANSLTTNDPIAHSLPTKSLTTNDLIAHSLPAKSLTTNSLTAKSLTLPAIACIVTLRLLLLYACTDSCVSITNSREQTMS